MKIVTVSPEGVSTKGTVHITLRKHPLVENLEETIEISLEGLFLIFVA